MARKKNISANNPVVISAQLQSEHLLCYIRLGIGSLFLFFATFELLLGISKLTPFIIQATSSAALIGYSSLFLLYLSKRPIPACLIYVTNFLDISIITTILYSFSLSGSDADFLTSAVVGAYLIITVFTAFHHRVTLSLFCGIVCLIAYTIFYNLYCSADPGCYVWSRGHITGLSLLVAVCAQSMLISRNNFKTAHKIISSEIKYLSVVHRLPEMLFTIDRNGKFLWANAASRNILALKETALLGRTLSSFLLHPNQLRLNKDGFRGTFEIFDHNNNPKIVDCVLQHFTTENAGSLYEGIMHDVTDRELAISQREQMKERLFQYQKMESLGTLASGMAHDFNNILQTVRDLSATVSAQTGEEQTRRRMDLIDETLTDAKFLVSELLALGKKNLLNTDTLSIQKLLNTIVPLYNSQLGSNYRIILDLPPQECFIQGDWEYLKRIFQNLFGNARDAMATGGTITVQCLTNTDTNPGTLTIRVTDTGTGIDKTTEEKIFDPFFTTKKPGKGTGLGLALVHRIVNLHKGEVSVESSSSKGTTFKISFPLTSQETLDHTKILPTKHLKTTILLLDDDPKIQEILKFYLKEFDYSIGEANDRETALKALRDNRDNCEIVLMDWNMGTEKPAETISRLREIKPDISIIIISGYAPDQKSIDELGIHKWFTKPYDKNRLDLEIQRILHAKSALSY